MGRGAYIPYFIISPPIFCCALFSENHLNPQVRINKMVNKHTVDYHPIPSQLISRIYPLIFLWTRKGFMSPESFLNIFLDLYIPPWLWKSFKFILLRLLTNTFLSQKIKSVHFYSRPKQTLPLVFNITPQAKENYPLLLNSLFRKSIFPSRKGGGGLWS